MPDWKKYHTQAKFLKIQQIMARVERNYEIFFVLFYDTTFFYKHNLNLKSMNMRALKSSIKTVIQKIGMSCNENIAYCNWKLQVKPKHWKNEWFLITLINTINEFKIHVQINQTKAVFWSTAISLPKFVWQIQIAYRFLTQVLENFTTTDGQTKINWDILLFRLLGCMKRKDMQKVHYSKQ